MLKFSIKAIRSMDEKHKIEKKSWLLKSQYVVIIAVLKVIRAIINIKWGI